MSNYFERVKAFVTELGYTIDKEVSEEQLIVINDEASGINHLIVDCEEDILVLEQFIFELPTDNVSTLKRLLQLNRELVHGALVLDESGKKVIFRDTLQLENLDLNELEASIKAISLMLGEHAVELIDFAKGS